MSEIKVIDTHVHCGTYVGCCYDHYLRKVRGTDIKGMVVFPPVEEIYNRYDPNFQDNEDWQERRRKANQLVLDLKRNGEGYDIFPFFFVWNDFAFPEIGSFSGIKWHRHENEPMYQYSNSLCHRFIERIEERNLPVILEEELYSTLYFIQFLAKGVRVIIPHLGTLNGGYEKLEEYDVWGMENVYTDTSFASKGQIESHMKEYGYKRVFFGSDYPFNDPRDELEKVLSLDISQRAKDAILRGNFIRLMKGVQKG